MNELLTDGAHLANPQKRPYAPLNGGETSRFTTKTGSRYFVLPGGACVRDKLDFRFLGTSFFRRDRQSDLVLFVNGEHVKMLRDAIKAGKLEGITIAVESEPRPGLHPMLLLGCGKPFWDYDGRNIGLRDPGFAWGLHVGSPITQLDVTPLA